MNGETGVTVCAAVIRHAHGLSLAYATSIRWRHVTLRYASAIGRASGQEGLNGCVVSRRQQSPVGGRLLNTYRAYAVNTQTRRRYQYVWR